MGNCYAEKCPNCGNIVEGKKVKTYTNKVTRQGAKSAVHMVTSAGGMSTGAAIGSMILPGVGTVVGGALGFIGSSMFNQKVNENIDKLGDKIEDEFLLMDYEFECPNCHHKWTRNEAEDCTSSEMIMLEAINNIIAKHLSVDLDRITANSDLIDDLGATKKGIVAISKELENIFDVELLNDIEDIVFVDDFYEKILGFSLWEEDDDQHFYRLFEKYLTNPPKDIDLNSIADVFHSGSEIYENPIFKARSLFVAATLRLLNFVGYMRDSEYANITLDTQKETLYQYINYAREEIMCDRDLDENDKEIKLVSFAIFAISLLDLKDDCDEDQSGILEFLSDEYQEVAEEYEAADSEDFLFNTEWLTNLCAQAFEQVRVLLPGQAGSSESSILSESKPSTSRLTEKEQEYVKELKEILEDGDISPRERRLLDKLRISLGITEVRGKQLESIISQPKLSPEEQEYLDEYKEIIAEGEVSQRDRRFLEKLRKVNGISEERAKEIENYI